MESLSTQVKLLNDKIRKITGENENLYGEVRDGQEKLRLSNNQVSKMSSDI